jgi:hypothetical protein
VRRIRPQFAVLRLSDCHSEEGRLPSAPTLLFAKSLSRSEYLDNAENNDKLLSEIIFSGKRSSCPSACHEGVRSWRLTLLILTLDGDESAASLTGRFNPGGKESITHSKGSWVDPVSF